MEINKETIGSVIIYLYSIEEYETCQALLTILKEHFSEGEEYELARKRYH